MTQSIFSKLRESLKKGNVDVTYTDIEQDIQSRALVKDPEFRLKGKWKKYMYKYNGYKVYKVDGEWVRNNLSVIFGHGGHGHVHEFIKLDEIWVAEKHFFECGCNINDIDQLFSSEFTKSVIIHEMVECEEMKKGKTFKEAHEIALEAERKAGFLDRASEYKTKKKKLHLF